MFRVGGLKGIGGGVLLFLALVVFGLLLFPTPRPHVSLPAEPLFRIAGFPIANSIVASWLSMIVLVGLFLAGTSRMRLVPTGFQNLVEALLEALLNFVEGVAGPKNARRFFPVVATIFLFVLANAWLSLLPGFNTIGFGKVEEYAGAFAGHAEGFIVETPLLRAANTDINTPLALALTSFFFVEYWGITSLGFFTYMGKFVRIGQLLRGRLFAGMVDIFVGALEAISEFIRIVSFTFRLFGNMTAGEVLLLMIAFLVPWVIAVPFYGLEMILGFVQALIFSGLTLVFATVAVAHHGEEH